MNTQPAAPETATGIRSSHPFGNPRPDRTGTIIVQQIEGSKLRIATLAPFVVPAVLSLPFCFGFLVMFTFCKSFGIEGTEFLQGKYIHVGSLFIMGLVVVAMPTFWVSQLVPQLANRRSGPLRGAWNPTLVGAVLYAAMLFSIYVVLAFTERGFFHRHALLVLSNFLAPLVYSFARLIFPSFVKDDAVTKVDATVGIGACAVALYLAYRTVTADRLWEHIQAIFPISPPSGAYGFLALTVLTVCYMSIAAARWGSADDGSARVKIFVSTTSLVGVFMFVAALAFAFSIYPYIPSEKGGGSYVDAVSVQLSLNSTSEKSIPGPIRSSISSDSSPFVIVYQNSNSVFVASKKDAGGPEKWQEPGSTKPTVYEVHRSVITVITYLNR